MYKTKENEETRICKAPLGYAEKEGFKPGKEE